MKILYISGMYPTPAYPQKGIFCHEQVKALMSLGVEVDVVVPYPFYDREVRCSVWEYEGVKINYVKFFKIPGTFDFHKTGKSLYRALKRRFDLSSYDVFHADAPLPAGDAVMRAAAKYKKPFAVHGHGLDVFLGESYAGTKNVDKIVEISKEVYSKANAVIGVSQKVLDKIKVLVDLNDTGFVAYNGVDVNSFIPIQNKQKSENVVITSIGNLIELKGHDISIRALKELMLKGYTNLRLKIAGRGYLEEELKALVSELGLQDYVEFIGYVPYQDIVKLLQSSDIFLLPSWYEALGCVYLEAMACGVPCIGCYQNGIDEVIKNGENGYLVNNKNIDEVVNAVEKLIENDNYLAMRENARKTVEDGFTWINSAQQLVKIYKNIIG